MTRFEEMRDNVKELESLLMQADIMRQERRDTPVQFQEGDKVRFVHLKEPNIYQSSAFSFITFMPKELDIYKFIDYDAQFEKSFVEPLKFITDKAKWLIDSSYGTQGTLEDFFA